MFETAKMNQPTRSARTMIGAALLVAALALGPAAASPANAASPTPPTPAGPVTTGDGIFLYSSSSTPAADSWSNAVKTYGATKVTAILTGIRSHAASGIVTLPDHATTASFPVKDVDSVISQLKTTGTATSSTLTTTLTAPTAAAAISDQDPTTWPTRERTRQAPERPGW
jgi:hypothetical protein